MSLNQAKQALVALAVNELAQEHEFDSITVDMICKRAQISRSGFYRAFEDKYAVLSWCDAFPIERGLGQIGRTFNIAQGVKVTFEGFGLFWNMFLSMDKSVKRRQHEDDSFRRAHKYFCETITQYHGLPLDANLDYQALWAARGTLVALKELQGDKDRDLDELSSMISSCYPPRLAKILDDPTEPTAEATLDLKALMLR